MNYLQVLGPNNIEVAAPFDGIRAINSIFCLFLSGWWALTANLPCEGALIAGIKNANVHRFMSIGRIHGDVGLMLSGFLFSLSYVIGANSGGYSFLVLCYVRLLQIIPANVIFMVISSVISDDPWLILSIPQKIYSFVMASYLDTNIYQSIYFQSISGHIAIDIHTSLIVLAIKYLICSDSSALSDLDVAIKMRGVFLVLIVIGIGIRILAFEKSIANEMTLGKYYNICLSLTLKQYDWARKKFNRKCF